MVHLVLRDDGTARNTMSIVAIGRISQRNTKKKLDSVILAEHLDKYAETGKEYVRVLQQIIKQNNLIDFDDAKLLPSSINLESLI